MEQEEIKGVKIMTLLFADKQVTVAYSEESLQL